VTPTDLHVFAGQCKELFPRSRWHDSEWELFLAKMKGQEFDVASRAIREHRAETAYTSPAIPKVMAWCKTIRDDVARESGRSHSGGRPDRAAEDLVAELRACWEGAARLHGTKVGARSVASTHLQRIVGQLVLRCGWTRDQAMAVATQISDGHLTHELLSSPLPAGHSHARSVVSR
jgi:hypothetical protein